MTNKSSILQSEPLNSRGMALMLCLLLMTILCLVGGAALGISRLNHQIVHNGAKQAQAFYTAEAGRQTALAFLNGDPVWRGDVPESGYFEDGFPVAGIEGVFSVSLSDCTADENGLYNAFLPAGHALLESTGTWIDAAATVSCLVRFFPEDTSAAAFPPVAVVSSGTVSGSLTALDDLGVENPVLLQAPAVLPAANASALKAMAETAFSSLDDDAWDAALGGVTSFWLDAPAETRPRILYIEGDLEISGERQLYGIVFVNGSQIDLDGESGIRGILYAPNATDVSIYNAGASGRIVVTGMLITGSGGVEISGNSVSVQCCPDYVDAFNLAAGSQVNVEVVSGSWKMR